MPIFESVFSRPLPIALTTPLRGLVGVMPSGSRPAPMQLGERLEHQVRVDRRGAVADQQRDVVDLARLAGLDHEAGLRGACPRGRGGGGPRPMASSDGHRRALGADVAVGEHR